MDLNSDCEDESELMCNILNVNTRAPRQSIHKIYSTLVEKDMILVENPKNKVARVIPGRA